MSHFLQILSAVVGVFTWPITVLVLAFSFRKSIIGVIDRIRHVKVSVVELLIAEVEEKKRLPVGAREELAGLEATQIWALNDFASGKISNEVEKMNPGQKVMARTLIDLKLLSLSGEAVGRKVIPTQLGRDLIEAAKSLL